MNFPKSNFKYGNIYSCLINSLTKRILLSPFFAFLLMILLNSHLIAANGSIEGTITDKKSKETLVGAQVILDGTTIGAVTNFDGHYIIDNIKPGTYNVKVSYISYNPVIIEGVVVSANKKSQLNM